MALLPDNLILALHAAALAAELDRTALLAGIPSGFSLGIPQIPNASAQLIVDLRYLNNAARLLDESVPLITWLRTAVQLAGFRRERGVFETALAFLVDKGQEPAPRPSYRDAATRALAEELEHARNCKRALEAAKAPTEVVSGRILEIRRKLREGGQLREGDTLGRYTLLELIGRGGFAGVWRALDQERNAVVAIKVLHANLAGDEIRRERFFRGARTMAGLDHPSIVKVLAPSDEDEGFHFFVMEHIDGEDLHRAVVNGRVSQQRALALVLVIGEALALAHQTGLVHRDVKPANILLGSKGEVKLTDFDLVGAGDTTGGTRTGALGSFLYTAPECMDKPQDADARADVFGLAMTAVFALHGGPLPQVVLRHTDAFVDELECGAATRDVLKRALDWNRDERFENAKVLCRALKWAMDEDMDIENNDVLRERRYALAVMGRTITLRTPGWNADDLPPPVPTEQLNHRYHDLGRLGVGGFSEVREVLDRHIGRKVARKEQLASRSSDDDCERFREEVRITASLQHPSIVPLYDWGQLADGRVWFTMKRVDAETIALRIQALHLLSGEEFTLGLRRLLDDFRRLCEPVAYAHAQRIIHRDLTPQNLMVGELGEVHVMDWGLARDLGRAARAGRPSSPDLGASDDITASEMLTRIAGTPRYMPPEQARGDLAAMGPESDVYALGAVLYEILSGVPPYYSAASAREPGDLILARVSLGPPRPIAELARREVPKELHALCERAMARAPRDRYPDAGALMNAVRDWLDGANRRERALRIVQEANRDHRDKIGAMREEIEQRRARAKEILDAVRPFDKAQTKAEGWNLEDEAAALEQEVLREEITWTQKLRSALKEVPELEEAHATLAEHYANELHRAEAERNAPAATRAAALLEEHASKLSEAGRTRYDAIRRGDGTLTLITEPADAQVLIKRYEPSLRYLMLDDRSAEQLRAPLASLELARGSYLLILSAPGYRDLRYPVMIGRGEHWDGIRPGGAAAEAIRLLREDELGLDDIYVPAGPFLAGGDPRAGEGLSRRRVWVDGFVIRKHPVTNAEYLDFLNALVAEGRGEEARRSCPRLHPGASLGDEDLLAYPLDPITGRFALDDAAQQASLPVVFIDWHAAMAYAAHLAKQTGLPWRLPSELEWEKAARGVDGRFMPWGDQMEPTWACVSGSHDQPKRLAPIHDYPTDTSPYGVRGMAGNVRDWCVERWSLDGPPVERGILKVMPASADDDEKRSLRGGAWTSTGDMMRLAVRYADKPSVRHGVLGFRLARSLGD